MRILLLSLITFGALESAWALKIGDRGCYGKTPLEPFELVNAESYTYAQSCRIPDLVNDLLMKRYLPQIRYCWESVLRDNAVEKVELPLTLSVTENRINVLAPTGDDLPMDLVKTELRECIITKVIARIQTLPAAQIREIGATPWMLKGILTFGISNR